MMTKMDLLNPKAISNIAMLKTLTAPEEQLLIIKHRCKCLKKEVW
jgi:hypothetical protein